MTKIINLVDYKNEIKYSEVILKTKSFLDDTQEKIQEHMVNLATHGVWKDFFDQFKEGDTFNFSQDMIENTGDKNIEMLWELCFKIEDVTKRMKNFLIYYKN
jgi:hypothetical protein